MAGAHFDPIPRCCALITAHTGEYNPGLYLRYLDGPTIDNRPLRSPGFNRLLLKPRFVVIDVATTGQPDQQIGAVPLERDVANFGRHTLNYGEPGGVHAVVPKRH